MRPQQAQTARPGPSGRKATCSRQTRHPTMPPHQRSSNGQCAKRHCGADVRGQRGRFARPPSCAPPPATHTQARPGNAIAPPAGNRFPLKYTDSKLASTGHVLLLLPLLLLLLLLRARLRHTLGRAATAGQGAGSH